MINGFKSVEDGMSVTDNYPLCGRVIKDYIKKSTKCCNKVVQAYCRQEGVFLMIFDKYANLKYNYGNRHFWAEGYYVSTVELNEATIRKYIEEQEKHDIALDKLSVKEYERPFKGCKKRAKGNRLEQSESQRF